MKAWLMAVYIGYCIGGFVALSLATNRTAEVYAVMIPGVLIVLYISYAGRTPSKKKRLPAMRAQTTRKRG